ncbi:hypothetical protein EC988_002813, partial [Linderina pennispora]
HIAMRRLVPAITVVPKNLDDDQLKKLIEQQQPITAKGAMPSKSELAQLTTQQGLISTLSKANKPMPLNNLLSKLTGPQGMLSTQDLALLKAASNGSPGPLLLDAKPVKEQDSLLTTPEPASPAPETALADQEPTIGALDPASVDALISALRGTAAISAPPPAEKPAVPRPARCTTPVSVLEEHNALASLESSEHSDDDLPPIPADLSAAERRKEQNRRAQKKFRQKDKVRQKEIKWRASQYEDLVASNKRFKSEVESVRRERDMYRRILELNGINMNDTELTTTQQQQQIPSPVLSPQASLAMDQIAQDTFGCAPAPITAPNSQLNDLLTTLVFGAVKSDPMFGTTVRPAQPVQEPAPWFDAMSPASEPLPAESPLNIDNVQYTQQPIDGHFVDPMTFIDELLASPAFTPSSSLSAQSSPAPDSLARKRTFEDAML